jgi:Ca2+-binding EF-hand superfamily protein
MKTLLILLTCFGLTAVAWAEMHEGKHHSGKMMFEKMDTNKDGTISVEEHEAGLNKMQERRREHFSKMDTNGDGLVTKEEAKAAHEAMRETMGEERRGKRQECKGDKDE